LVEFVLLSVFLENTCIAGPWKYLFKKNEGKGCHPNDGVIVLSLLKSIDG